MSVHGAWPDLKVLVACALGELATRLMKVMGYEMPVVQTSERARPEVSEIDRLQDDSSLARELTGWEPNHTLDKRLQFTIDWVKENIPAFRPGSYAI